MIHPDHLLDVLTPRQFEEWCEHFRAEPFGLEDLQHARLMALVTSVAGGKIDGRQPVHHDFILGAEEGEAGGPEMSTAETVAALTELWNGAAPAPEEADRG